MSLLGLNKQQEGVAKRVMQGEKKKLRSLNAGRYCDSCKNWNEKNAVFCEWCPLLLSEQ